MKRTSPKPKERREPKVRQRPFKKNVKHNLAKQELDTLQKANLAKIAEMELKTLQTDLDKKVTKTQPIIDGLTV
jgi:hypothetical protein